MTVRVASPLRLQIDHSRRTTRTLEIARLYTEGVPVLDICERYTISRTQVHRIVRLHGLTLRPRGFGREKRDGVISALELGLPYAEISARFGVSEAYCSKLAKDCGLERYKKRSEDALD